MAKLRKQVSIDFLNHLKITINDMLSSKLPQFAKQKLCIMMEKALMETKSYNGFLHLYWRKYGSLDWEAEKENAARISTIHIPKEFIVGPEDDGKPEFTSDIQGEYSRFYL